MLVIRDRRGCKTSPGPVAVSRFKLGSKAGFGADISLYQLYPCIPLGISPLDNPTRFELHAACCMLLEPGRDSQRTIKR